jgi:M6 family metalloprotease-like protein
MLLACGALAMAAPASALIVWKGKIVREWPEEAGEMDSSAQRMQSPAHPIGRYPHPKGTVWGLTILIDFSDTAPAFTKEQVDGWLNQRGYAEGGLKGSIRDYFFDNSNGIVDFQNQVVGFYRASQPKSYYESDSGYSRASALVSEAVAALDGQVDFSIFDNDGNGQTEAISIVYAGPMEAFGRGLWPHAGAINTTRDAVRVSRYQMTAMGSRLALYTFAHEVGHMLFGWPDLYGFGNYCIMGNASDSRNPVGINDLYRADQGWIPIVDIDSTMNARFYAAPNAGGYRYVNPQRPEEAFFWSNVQNTNRWSTLRGSGLVLLHFDYAIRRNDPPNPLGLAVVQADGLKQLDETQWPEPGSDAADFFHAGTKAEFSGSTSPASRWNNGSASGLRIHEISANGAMMTFAVGTGTPGPGIGGSPGAAGMSAGGVSSAGMSSGGTSGGGMSAGGRAGSNAGGSGAAGASSGAAGSLSGMGGTVGAAGVPTVAGSTSLGGAGGSSAGATSGATGGAPVPGAPGGAGSSGATASGNAAGTAFGAGVGGMNAPGFPVAGSDVESGCTCRQTSAPFQRTPWLLALLGFSLSLGRRLRRPPSFTA